MISRGAPGAYVCCRCQLRLLKSPSTNSAALSHLGRPQGARLLHNGASSESVETSSTLAQEPESSQNGQYVDITKEATKIKQTRDFRRSGTWHPLREKTVTERPLGRLYGFRGHKLREKRAELNVTSLGTPAEVIVLRDAGFHSNPPPEIEELKAVEKVDILTQLDAERGLITQADVEKNIEEFRPKTKTISWVELQQLQRELVSGFTTSQLVKYADAHGRRQKKAEGEHEVGTRQGSLGAVIRKTQWMPRNSETGDEFEESPLRGYDSEAFTPKQRLVLLLLRQSWQLDAQEVIDSIGEVELEIPGMELELLIGGRTPPLKVISNEFIASQEEKIEAFRSRGVVRITAAKEKSEAIVQEIQAMLQGIRSLTIDLNALISGPKLSRAGTGSPSESLYDEYLINELAKLTETHITRLPNNQISVSCVHAKSETHLSTKADVARRLLLTSSDLANRTKTVQACKETLEPRVAVKYHMTDGMSWRDRLRHWVRWTSATRKSSELQKRRDVTSLQQATKYSGTVDKTGIENSFSTNSARLPVSQGLSQEAINQTKLQKTSNMPSEYAYWDLDSFTETSAIVGHILFEAPAAAEVSTKVVEDVAAQRTIFHPVPVNISRLLGSIPLLNDMPTTSLVLRFIPSPWTAGGHEVLASLPPVEMRFAVEPNTKALHLKDVIAVIESTASDVMLPDRILDIRFQQRTTTRIRALHRHQLPQISEFIESSQLNLMRGRLETPPGLILPIATHLCNGPVPEALQKPVDESISAEYIFGGLEYRSTLALDFKGWQLLYTSVEGGKADGRRAELSLRPRRVKGEISDSMKSSATWTEEFIHAAYGLVDTLANYDTAPAGSVTSSTLVHDIKGLSGRSYETNLGKNQGFRYFRESINFIVNPTMEDEGFDEETEKY